MSQDRPSTCSLGSLGPCEGTQSKKKDFSNDDWICLKCRSGIGHIKTVCDSHVSQFLTFYSLREKYCCDPNSKHDKQVLGTRLITVENYRRSKEARQILDRPLIPGKKLCKRCASLLSALTIFPEALDTPSSTQSRADVSQDLFSDEEEVKKSLSEPLDQPVVEARAEIAEQIAGGNDNLRVYDPKPSTSFHNFLVPQSPQLSQTSDKAVKESDEDTTGSEPIPSSGEQFSCQEVAIETLNATLKTLHESPLKKKRMSVPSYARTKINKIKDKVETLMVQGGASSAAVSQSEDSEFRDKVISALQKKFQDSKTVAEKIAVLSVVLAGVSQARAFELFGHLGATIFLMKKTSKLVTEQGLFPSVTPKIGRTLSEEVKKLVINHYESDTYSRQLPGKKDYVIIRKDGEKTYVQKKLILCNLKELYQSFKTEHPAASISFSKFAYLRPRHCVLAGSTGTHSVCVCKYCQNVKLLIEAFDFKSIDHSLDSYKDFLYCSLCTPPSASCFLRTCKDCPGFDLLHEHLSTILDENFVENVTYRQWTSVDRCTLETHTKESEGYLEMLIEKLEELAPHHFINKQQGQYLRDLKENLGPDEAVTICDFSENYTFIVQDSIQSFYFSSDQATIHPFVTYFKSGEELKVLSFTVISDFMKHGTTAFYAFQKKLIDFLKIHIPGLKKMYYFSDGAASQYKNQFNVLNLSYHEQDFGIKAEWHFFATSHGKGPSDGVGGALKRAAARASIQGIVITTPYQLYCWAKEAFPNIVVAFVSKEEVSEASTFLTPRFSRALPVEQIRSHHKFVPVSEGEIEASRFSSAEDSTYAPVELIRKLVQLESIEIGDIMAVHCKGRTWTLVQVSNFTPDEILAIRLKEVKKGASRQFRLPGTDNEETFSVTSILAKVDPVHIPPDAFQLMPKDRQRIHWQLKAMKTN